MLRLFFVAPYPIARSHAAAVTTEVYDPRVSREIEAVTGVRSNRVDSEAPSCVTTVEFVTTVPRTAQNLRCCRTGLSLLRRRIW